MNCKEFRQESEELVTGQPVSVAAQTHLNSCVACRTFQSERISLRQLIGSLSPVNAPPDFDFRLRARLAIAKSERSAHLRRARLAPGLKAISVAASFVLLITAAVVFKQFQSGQGTPSANSANGTVVKGNAQGQQNSSIESKPPMVANAVEQTAQVDNRYGASMPGDNSLNSDAGKVAIVKKARNPYSKPTNRMTILDNDVTLKGDPPVITPVQQSTLNSSVGDATVSLRVPTHPVKLLLHDRQGTMRSLSLEPVVFGSEDFLERAAHLPKSGADVEGIW